jgi:hypothetical protein
MDGQDLIGTWRPRSWTDAGSDGSVVEPLTFQGVERRASLVWERVGTD